MNRLAFAGMCALALGMPLTVFATSQRTFVAAAGSDTQPCTLAQPCRSFAAAIAKTSSNGEVLVLDSAGYGPVTIGQSVSIIAPAGVYAGITIISGNGVTIDGSGIVVALRGLAISGAGGFYGIDFEQGSGLVVESCEISNLGNSGMLLRATNSRVTIQNTVIRNNDFSGINTFQSAGDMRVTIASSTIADNAIGIIAKADAGAMQVTVARSVLTGNGIAAEVTALAGATASVLSDGNSITYSTTVFSLGGAGSSGIFTPGNNTIGYYGILINGGSLSSCCGT